MFFSPFNFLPDSKQFKVNFGMRLLADGVWSRAQSLEFHSLDGDSQGFISTKSLGIHKGLGIMFSAFVHTNPKKSLNMSFMA